MLLGAQKENIMRHILLITALLAMLAGVLYAAPATISNVRIGFEVPEEGPFPASTVFRGDTLMLTWKTRNISGNVLVELRRSNHSVAAVIYPRYPYNDMPGTYRIPAGLALGRYYARVSQGAVYGNSNPFIVKGRRNISRITVFLEGQPTPPGGFTTGQTLAVSWSTSDILGQISLFLIRAQAPSQQFTISANRPSGDIPATYGLHNGINPGVFYVEIRQGTQRWRSARFNINAAVIGPRKLPDLVIKKVKWEFTKIKPGPRKNFVITKAEIANIGKGPLPKSKNITLIIRLIANKRQVIWENPKGIPFARFKSSSTSRLIIPYEKIKLQIERARTLEFTIQVDYKNSIKESNERNNMYGPVLIKPVLK